MGNLDTQYLFADVFYFHLIPSIISLSDNPSKTKKQYQFEYCVREYLIAPLYICSRSHTPSNGQGRFDRERKNLKEKFKKNPFFFYFGINIFLRLTLQHCTSFACLFSRISFIYKSLWLSFQIFLFQTVPRYINEIIQDLLSDREFCVDKKFSGRRVEFRIFGGEISFCFLCTYRHPSMNAF